MVWVPVCVGCSTGRVDVDRTCGVEHELDIRVRNRSLTIPIPRNIKVGLMVDIKRKKSINRTPNAAFITGRTNFAFDF